MLSGAVRHTGMAALGGAEEDVAEMGAIDGEPTPKRLCGGLDDRRGADREATSDPKALTCEWFGTTAMPLALELPAMPVKMFRTGSCGWYMNKKQLASVGGEELVVSVQCCCTVVGSKQWLDR